MLGSAKAKSSKSLKRIETSESYGTALSNWICIWSVCTFAYTIRSEHLKRFFEAFRSIWNPQRWVRRGRFYCLNIQMATKQWNCAMYKIQELFWLKVSNNLEITLLFEDFYSPVKERELSKHWGALRLRQKQRSWGTVSN